MSTTWNWIPDSSCPDPCCHKIWTYETYERNEIIKVTWGTNKWWVHEWLTGWVVQQYTFENYSSSITTTTSCTWSSNIQSSWANVRFETFLWSAEHIPHYLPRLKSKILTSGSLPNLVFTFGVENGLTTFQDCLEFWPTKSNVIILALISYIHFLVIAWLWRAAWNVRVLLGYSTRYPSSHLWINVTGSRSFDCKAMRCWAYRYVIFSIIQRVLKYPKYTVHGILTGRSKFSTALRQPTTAEAAEAEPSTEAQERQDLNSLGRSKNY